MIKYVAHHCRNTKNGTCNNIWIDKDITNAKTVAPSWKYCAECCKKMGIDFDAQKPQDYMSESKKSAVKKATANLLAKYQKMTK